MREMKKIVSILLVFVVLSTVIAGCGKTEKKSTDTIRIGTNRALGTVTPLLAEKLGYLKDNNIDFEVVEFSDGPSLMEAMAAGELDIALGGIVPVATWVAKKCSIKIVAGVNGGGHVILSKESTRIKTIEDLKKHSLATPSVGSVTDVMLKSFILDGAGVDPEDINIMPGMKPADMASSLEVTREVDAIMTWEPFASQAEQTYDDMNVVCDLSEEWKKATGSEDTYPVNVVCATDDFIKNDSIKLSTLLEALKKTVDYINGDKHSDAVNKIAEILEVDSSVIEKACERTEFSYNINKNDVNTILGWANDLGYLSEVPDDKDLFYNID